MSEEQDLQQGIGDKEQQEEIEMQFEQKNQEEVVELAEEFKEYVGKPTRKDLKAQMEEWDKEEKEKPFPNMNFNEPEKSDEEEEEEEEQAEQISERPQITGAHPVRDFSHQERLVKDYEEPLSIWDVPLFQNRVNHGLVDELREKVKRGLDYEFKVLRASTETFWHNVGTLGEQTQLKKYSRNLDSLPQRNRIPDKTYEQDNLLGRLEFLNASFSNNVFNHKKAFIVTQAPHKEQILEFWQMALINQVKMIIMACDTKGKCQYTDLPQLPDTEQKNPNKIEDKNPKKIDVIYEQCSEYWPLKRDDKLSYEKEQLHVMMESDQTDPKYKNLVKRELIIHWKTVIKWKIQEMKLTTTQIQWQEWEKDKAPQNSDKFNNMQKITSEVEKHWKEWLDEYKQKKDKNKKDPYLRPILIHSSECMGRTGVVLACIHIKMILEFYLREVTRLRRKKMNLEQIFQSETRNRTSRYRFSASLEEQEKKGDVINGFGYYLLDFVRTFEQYQYVYEYALFEIEKFNSKVKKSFEKEQQKEQQEKEQEKEQLKEKVKEKVKKSPKKQRAQE